MNFHLLFSALLFVCFALSSPVLGQQRLRVGVLDNFPPQYSQTSAGEPTGLAIDLFDQIAIAAAVDYEYRSYPSWNDMHQALLQGEIDLIPNMGIADFRQADFSFSQPLETVPIVLFTRRSNLAIDSIHDFRTAPLGVVHLNVGEEISQNYLGLQVRKYADGIAAFHGLVAGHVDGVIFPQTTFLKYARESRLEERLRIVGPPLREIRRGLSVAKGNEPLLETFAPAIEHVLASQEYQQLLAKWYGTRVPFWTPGKIVWTLVLLLFVAVGIMLFWRNSSLKKLSRNLRQELDQKSRDCAEQEELLKQIMDNQQSAIFLHQRLEDGFSAFTEANRSAETLYGYSRAEFLKLTAEDITTQSEFQSRVERYKIQISSQGRSFFETVHRAKDGREFPVEINSVIIRLGGEDYFLTDVRDISERKQAEKDAERSWDVLQNSLNEIYIFSADDYCIVEANRRALENLGYSLDEVRGKRIDTLLDSLGPQEIEQMLSRLKSGATPYLNFEVSLQRKDGSRYPVAIQAQYYPGSPAVFVFSALAGEELTQIKDELEKTREELITLKAIHEGLVSEHTRELKKVIGLMSGRELRMVELKQEIMDLSQRLDIYENLK